MNVEPIEIVAVKPTVTCQQPVALDNCMRTHEKIRQYPISAPASPTIVDMESSPHATQHQG